MIARGTPVGAVCFRCRLQLLRQLTPAHFTTSHASRGAINDANGDTGDDAGHDAFDSAFQDILKEPVRRPARRPLIRHISRPAHRPAQRPAHRLVRRIANSTLKEGLVGLENAVHGPISNALNGRVDNTGNDTVSGVELFGSAVSDTVSGSGDNAANDIVSGVESAGGPARDTFNNTVDDTANEIISGVKQADGPFSDTVDGTVNRPFPIVRRVDSLKGGSHARESERSRGRSRGKAVYKRFNLRNRYMSGPRLLTETSMSLDMDMLNAPARIIVMRDGGIVKKEKVPDAPPLETDAESAESLNADIKAILERKRQRATVDEARSNIEEVRPKVGKILPEKEFRGLLNQLTEGFLRHQLLDYIKWYQSDPDREPEATADSNLSIPEYPWIRDIVPWTPLPTQSSPLGEATSTLQAYVSDNMPPKEKLAMIVMRDCWGLSIAELETQLGETHIQLHDHDFILLLRGNRRFINTLGRFWLRPGEKLELIHDKSMLRLVSAKLKAESVLGGLDQTLRNVMTKAFPLHPVASQVPDDDTLEELGRITNSHLSTSKTRAREEQLHVKWIEIKSRAAQGLVGLEDVSHIVFRLLLLASKALQPPTTLLSPILPQESRGRLILDTMNKNKFMWKDRLAQWARYVFPLTLEASAANMEMPIQQLELPFEPSKEPEKFVEDLGIVSSTDFLSHPVKWNNTPRTSTVARFGQLLHPYNPSNPAPPISDLLANNTNDRVFSPITPHPLHLASHDLNSSDNTPLVLAKSTVVIYLWPSPSPNRKDQAPPAPPLELRLTASDDEITGIDSLRAIKRTHHTDVMLPSSPMDVRFTQTQYETLVAPNREALGTWRPLVDLLDEARLDLANGKLEMPPRQKFPIPRRLLTAEYRDSIATSSPSTAVPEGGVGEQDQEEQSSDQDQKSVDQEEIVSQNEAPEDRPAPRKRGRPRKVKKPEPTKPEPTKPEPDDPLSVTYEFIGLELHRAISQPYNGHKLTYTSIEAGKGGGRRAEVTLEPLEPSESDAPVKGDGLQDFLNCCSKFISDPSMWSSLVNGRDKK
ncbi:mitochondrial inner-membrane-bound regulator-domain-containing protein [Xylaria sp. CBS 124048]|nr:mitochondrial inner-membrane-bound regulator-domain-containing protein [Xylaria sp. CBS 124048]